MLRAIAVAAVVLVVAAIVLRIVAAGHGTRTSLPAPAPATVALDGLTYQAVDARTLDPGNPVDRVILHGIPATRRPLPRATEWFGVFLSVGNPSRHALPDARHFLLTDRGGSRFGPERRVGDDVYAYRPGIVPAGGSYPAPASAAAHNLTAQGALILFRLPRGSASLGPRDLWIAGPGRRSLAELAVS